jgi:hypothetical protein
VIGFVEWQMDLEQVQAPVDGVDETEASGQKMDGPDAAVGEAVSFVSDVVVDVAGCEGGSFGLAQLGFVEPSLNAALAAGQLLAYLGVHSKSLSAGGEGVWSHP